MMDFSPFVRFQQVRFKIISLIPEWAQAYQVDEQAIERQIGIAHCWCNANPKKAPKKDPVRFLNNWMRLAKKMGSLVSQPIDRTYKEKPAEEDLSIDEMREIRRRNFPQYKADPVKFPDSVTTEIVDEDQRKSA